MRNLTFTWVGWGKLNRKWQASSAFFFSGAEVTNCYQHVFGRQPSGRLKKDPRTYPKEFQTINSVTECCETLKPIKNNIVANSTKRSAKAKLVNNKCGRLPNFFFRSVALVREFPTTIRKAITPKQVVHKGFHLFKSIFTPNA